MSEPILVSAIIEYKLSNFSSLFEVAIGLNLVFSLWEAIRNLAIIKFTKVSSDLATELKALLGESYPDMRCAVMLEEKKDKYLSRLQKFAIFAKWAGIFTIVLLICVLITIGIDPELLITSTVLYILIFFSVILSPLCIIIGNVYVLLCKSKLADLKDQQSMAFQDMKKVYDQAAI